MHATDFLKDPAEAKIGPAAVLYGPEFFLKRESLAALVASAIGGAEWVQVGAGSAGGAGRKPGATVSPMGKAEV